MSWATRHTFTIFFVVNLAIGTDNVAHGQVYLSAFNYAIAGMCLVLAIAERRERNKNAKEI